MTEAARRDSAEEVGGACIVSGGNRTGVLACGEDILDQMSGLLHVRIVVALFRAVCCGRDHGFDARLGQPITDTRLRARRLVGPERLTRFKPVGQQGIRPFQIVGVSRCQMKPCRSAPRIAACMDVGGQPAFGAPDACRFPVPPCAPAECGWARTMVESSIASSWSASSARCSNILCQTPRVLQRVWRVWITRQSPNRSGRSRHAIPARDRYHTASMNSRLSLAVPPTCPSRPGRNSLIRSPWSSHHASRLPIHKPPPLAHEE